MKMESTVEVLRGWPADGARERMETIKAAVTLRAGDLVAKQPDGTVDKSAASVSNRVGLVIAGNGDSASAAGTNKALVLWGNYIVRVATSAVTAGAYVPGSPVTANAGKFTLGNGSTDPEVGFVLDVTSASATATASLVIVVR